jgi:hypothetical protein
VRIILAAAFALAGLANLLTGTQIEAAVYFVGAALLVKDDVP